MRKIFISIALLAGFIAALNAQVVIKVGDAILENNATVDITAFTTEDGTEEMKFEGMVINQSATPINVIGKITKQEMIGDGHFALCYLYPPLWRLLMVKESTSLCIINFPCPMKGIRELSLLAASPRVVLPAQNWLQ